MSDGRNILPAEISAAGSMVMVRKPEAILAEASEAAKALKKVLTAKENPVIFNGERYLEFEDWQTMGNFYHCIARITWTRPVQFGDAFGFEAGADVVDSQTGQIISSAEAMCLNDEEKWSKRAKYEWQYVLKDGSKQAEDPGSDQIQWIPNPSKPGKKMPMKEKVKVGDVAVPLFQLRSMAQTRAGAKALRNVFAWVVVLAGFKPTVAEELTGREEGLQGDREAPIESAKVKDQPQADQAAPAAPAQPKGDLFGNPTAAAPAPAADDVFTKLEKALANYCDGDTEAMQEKLMALTSFEEMKKDENGKYTKEKTGKVIPGKRFVNELRKSKSGGQAWAGSALRKLEEELAGER